MSIPSLECFTSKNTVGIIHFCRMSGHICESMSNPFIVAVPWNVQKGKTREFQLFVFCWMWVSSLHISGSSAFRLCFSIRFYWQFYLCSCVYVCVQYTFAYTTNIKMIQNGCMKQTIKASKATTTTTTKRNNLKTDCLR